MPTNSTLTIHKQTVLIHPIIDEFYNHAPTHARSSKLARDKGQMSTKSVISTTGSGEMTPEVSIIQPRVLVDDVSVKLSALEARTSRLVI